MLSLLNPQIMKSERTRIIALIITMITFVNVTIIHALGKPEVLNISATNFMANWDGNGAIGAGSEPSNFGWDCTPAVTWTQANVFGIRFQDDQTYTYKGSPLLGRILFVRWDGVNGAGTSSIYSYPAELEGCKTYEFTAKIAWHNNAGAPNYTYQINTTKDNSGTTLAKGELLVPGKGTMYDMKLLFSTNEAGTYYFTLGASDAVLGSIRDLSLTEYAGEPFLNLSEEELIYDSINLVHKFDLNAFGLTDLITFSGPEGMTFSPESVTPEEAGCGTTITATFENGEAVSDGEISASSGSITEIIQVTEILPAWMAEGTDAITSDGTWCWFQDPRAVYFEGNKKQTYTGWINSKGKVQVASYNHETGNIRVNTISPANFMQVDDHNNPTILVRDDGHVLASYSGHFYGPMRVIVSKNPEDISSFGPEANFGNNVTYANPYQIGDSTVMFYRDGVTWHPTMNVSLDGGETWGSPQEFITRNGSQQRPYAKYTQDSKGGMHITFTTGHPRVEPNNKIYYVYYYKHKFYKADGSFIKNYNSASDALNIDAGEAEVVYNASTGKGWTWDIALDEDENPVILYAAFPNDLNHHYYYATWDGSKWISNHIVNSGRWFPQTPEGGTEPEPNYSGGMVIDPENPSIVYLSKQVNGVFEIFKYTTNDKGASWETKAITANTPEGIINVRPIIPRGHQPGSFDVVWLRGTYVTYANFHTSVMYYSPNKLNSKLDSITVNGEQLKDFDTDSSSFIVVLPKGETEVPVIQGFSSVPFAKVIVEQANNIPGKAIITVITEGNTRTAKYTVTIKTSDETAINSTQINANFLYPNPIKSSVSFDLSQFDNIETISFVSLRGSVVYTFPNTSKEAHFNVDLAHLDDGLYLVQLLDSDDRIIETNHLIKRN